MTLEEAELKICNSCKTSKPFSEYYFRKDTGKYKNRCKVCCIAGVNMVRSETHKVCKHCGVEKPFDEYQKAGGGNWLQPYCKPCDAERKKKWVNENEDVIKNKRKSHYLQNRILVSPEQKAASRIFCNQVIANAGREYANKIRMSPEEKKAKKAAWSKKFREKHADKIREKKRDYMKRRGNKLKCEWQARKMSGINFKITKNLRGRIYVALKRGIKSDTTMNLLGCSIEDFKVHIEAMFLDGMTWSNMGEWHLDHIRPCATFDLTLAENQRICFHYSNIQPLWGVDNLKKGVKYDRQRA